MACTPASLPTCRTKPYEQLVMVRLIPEKDGGLRPIALFRTAYRIFWKTRTWQLRDWIQHAQRTGFNMTGNRRTLDAAWRCRIRDLARDTGHASDIQMDLRKAFEQVNRGRLLDLALHEVCPMRPLLLSLLSYQWPRRLACQKYVGTPIRPTRGVAAGSSLATFELEIYLTAAVRRATSVLPRPVISRSTPPALHCGRPHAISPRRWQHATTNLWLHWSSSSPLTKLSSSSATNHSGRLCSGRWGGVLALLPSRPIGSGRTTLSTPRHADASCTDRPNGSRFTQAGSNA
jgi:hypothetical protein